MSYQEEHTETEKTDKSQSTDSKTKQDKFYTPSSVDPLRNEMNVKHFVNDYNGFA